MMVSNDFLVSLGVAGVASIFAESYPTKVAVVVSSIFFGIGFDSKEPHVAQPYALGIIAQIFFGALGARLFPESFNKAEFVSVAVGFVFFKIITNALASRLEAPIKALNFLKEINSIGSARSGSIHGLLSASSQIAMLVDSAPMGKKLYAWIDSSVSFFLTAACAIPRLVMHLAFTALSLLGVTFQSGRALIKENLIQSFIDLSTIGIGLVGTIYPRAGQDATTKLIMFLSAVEFLRKEVHFQSMLPQP